MREYPINPAWVEVSSEQLRKCIGLRYWFDYYVDFEGPSADSFPPNVVLNDRHIVNADPDDGRHWRLLVRKNDYYKHQCKLKEVL